MHKSAGIPECRSSVESTLELSTFSRTGTGAEGYGVKSDTWARMPSAFTCPRNPWYVTEWLEAEVSIYIIYQLQFLIAYRSQ